MKEFWVAFKLALPALLVIALIAYLAVEYAL